jgi:hypothetical protein
MLVLFIGRVDFSFGPSKTRFLGYNILSGPGILEALGTENRDARQACLFFVSPAQGSL